MSDPWIYTPRPLAAPRLRLVCLPFAGGGSATYRGWEDGLPDDVELTIVIPPGRERRLFEPPVSDALQLVAQVRQALDPLLDRPFALFGHSMGALLSFELARALQREGGPTPERLFISAHRAPHRPYPRPPVSDLSATEFAEVLREFNGTPNEVLESTELFELLLPALRADFAVCETYVHREASPLECPIDVLCGRLDRDVTAENVVGWDAQTRAECQEHWFDGDHFFLNDQRAALLELVAQRLRA